MINKTLKHEGEFVLGLTELKGEIYAFYHYLTPGYLLGSA